MIITLQDVVVILGLLVDGPLSQGEMIETGWLSGGDY